MCQLTMVDMQHKEYLPGDTLRWLISMNSKEGHVDGFGCYLWDKDFLIKTKEEASPWLRKNFRTEIYPKSINGIFHVRRASVKTAKDQIKDSHAHPFEENGLVLAHNGTLTENFGYNNHAIKQEFEKLEKEDVIDSQKFLHILSTVKGDKPLTPEIIKETMEYFLGPFAMLIYSKEQKEVFVLKDNEKFLNSAIFSLADVPVGIILNTKYYMLDVITEILCDVLRKPVFMQIDDLPKNSIFVYKPGTYKLEKVADIFQSTRKFATVTPATTAVKSAQIPFDGVISQGVGIQHYGKTVEGIIDGILSIAKKIHLNFNDLCLLYELFFDESILAADREDLINLKYILQEIEKQATDNRIERIEEIAKLFPENDGLEFFLPFSSLSGTISNYPPVLNGKAELTKALDIISKKGLVQ